MVVLLFVPLMSLLSSYEHGRALKAWSYFLYDIEMSRGSAGLYGGTWVETETGMLPFASREVFFYPTV